MAGLTQVNLFLNLHRSGFTKQYLNNFKSTSDYNVALELGKRMILQRNDTTGNPIVSLNIKDTDNYREAIEYGMKMIREELPLKRGGSSTNVFPIPIDGKEITEQPFIQGRSKTPSDSSQMPIKTQHIYEPTLMEVERYIFINYNEGYEKKDFRNVCSIQDLSTDSSMG